MITILLVHKLQVMTSRAEHVKDSDIKILCDSRDFNIGDFNEEISVVWAFYNIFLFKKRS